jgi:hypothetical protein
MAGYLPVAANSLKAMYCELVVSSRKWVKNMPMQETFFFLYNLVKRSLVLDLNRKENLK